MPDKRIGDPRLREDDEMGGGFRGRSPLGEGVTADTTKAWPQSEHSSGEARGHVSLKPHALSWGCSESEA